MRIIPLIILGAALAGCAGWSVTAAEERQRLAALEKELDRARAEIVALEAVDAPEGEINAAREREGVLEERATKVRRDVDTLEGRAERQGERRGRLFEQLIALALPALSLLKGVS